MTKSGGRPAPSTEGLGTIGAACAQTFAAAVAPVSIPDRPKASARTGLRRLQRRGAGRGHAACAGPEAAWRQRRRPGAAGPKHRLFAARPQQYNDWLLARHCMKARSLASDLANLAGVAA